MSEIPDGWVPIPHGVEPDVAHTVAQALLAQASAVLPGFIHDDEAERQTIWAITRPPISVRTRARLWHLLGPTATGTIVDLSIEDDVGSLEARSGGPFRFAHLVRTFSTTEGLTTLSIVAPSLDDAPAMLLRSQHVVGNSVHIADVLDADAALIGRVIDDIVDIVRG